MEDEEDNSERQSRRDFEKRSGSLGSKTDRIAYEQSSATSESKEMSAEKK